MRRLRLLSAALFAAMAAGAMAAPAVLASITMRPID